MGLIVRFLTSRIAGPIGFGLAALLALWLLSTLATATVRVGVLRKALADASATLDATRSDLATCQGNTATLQAALSRQDEAVRALAAEGASRVAAAEKALQRAKSETARAEAASARILARPPVGADVCERVNDVDRKLLESLP